ncbi:MAG: hypothetical protein Q8K30_05315 [Candidatus Gracilibacteria bacterium]|nr:hypothetical protein [Candidatus Gracilibacteria bacterium]
MELYSFIFEYDKFRHFTLSLILFVIIFCIRKYKLKNKGLLKVISYTIRDVFIIGIIKEIIDLMGFGEPNISDIVANSVGIIAPIYVYYIIRESEQIEKSKFFIYEIEVFKELKQKIKTTYKRTNSLIKIKHKQLFYKKRIFNAIENRILTHYFKKSLIELVKIIKTTIILSLIWLINMIFLLFKIPYLALIDTYSLVMKSLNYGYKKVLN